MARSFCRPVRTTLTPRSKGLLKDVNVIDESNLNDVMLTVADPDEAVAYFTKTLQQNPDRIDLKRGLAKSLVRAKKPTEAAQVWRTVVAHPDSHAGRPGVAGRCADPLEQLDPRPRPNSTRSRRPTKALTATGLEAMVADSDKNWKKADSFYEIAAGLTTTPASVLNNWGFSKLTRGDGPGAEKLFTESLTYDPVRFHREEQPRPRPRRAAQV